MKGVTQLESLGPTNVVDVEYLISVFLGRRTVVSFCIKTLSYCRFGELRNIILLISFYSSGKLPCVFNLTSMSHSLKTRRLLRDDESKYEEVYHMQ